MYSLFDASGNNLADSFKNLSEKDIIDICGVRNVNKGIDYLNDKLIRETSFNETKTLFKAMVRGNSDYQVTVRQRNNEIIGSCSCPVDGICKHLAAVLFYLRKTTETESGSENGQTEQAVEQYIKSLSKQELIRLLRKYAPESFWNELKNHHSDKNTALDLFKNVDRKIHNLFKDDDQLYDPLAFETELGNVLSHLIGLENVLPKESEQLIFYILDTIEKVQDEGMLYDDYNDNLFSSPEVFDKFVENYALNLNFEDKLQFLTKLDLALENQSYDTFLHLLALSNTLFTLDELPLLKETFLRKKDNLPSVYKENFYNLVENLLTDDEKEHLLTSMQFDDPRWLIELVRLYDLKGNFQKALETVKKYMESKICKKNEGVYALYLRLLKKNQIPLEGIAEVAMNSYPSQIMLLNVIDADPGNALKYEQILLKMRPDEGLNYLEKMNRLQEAFELVTKSTSIYEDRKKEFFKKHKTKFPAEATAFFRTLISEHLKEAGEHHYYAIVEAIGQLLVIDQKLAKQILEDIRVNYRRRRNLISLLGKY